MNKIRIYCATILVVCLQTVIGTEFTFELKENTETCFHEMIVAGTPVSLEFQVVSGGNLDIDVLMKGPDQDIIFQKKREEYGTHQFTANTSGEYDVCFGNEFSTFTHKYVYIALDVGDEKPIIPAPETGPLTFMETTSNEMHKSLNAIIDTQTHYRLQEAQGRRFAEDVNERVLMWSIMQTFVIIAVSISQVLTLRNFFDEPVRSSVRARQPRYGRM